MQELNYQLEDDQRQYESALNDRDAQIRKMREECQALMVELQVRFPLVNPQNHMTPICA